MSGPQFFRIQSYSRKPNPVGQHIEQILGEAARVPAWSRHVEAPQRPRVIYGLAPLEVQRRHDEMVANGGIEVHLKTGKTARRGIRKDRHTLLTAIASHPFLTSQIEGDATARKSYNDWRARNVAWLQECYGDQLVSVVEHLDEEHPHLHAYILPLEDPACQAQALNPAHVAKTKAEAEARSAGQDDRTAVKLGRQAYTARARELQDSYHREVGAPSGLTRTGPSRERLSRQQWKARKAAATREAELFRETDARLGKLLEAEEALEADVTEQQELASQLVAEAEDYRSLAQQEWDEAQAARERTRERIEREVEAARAREAELARQQLADRREAMLEAQQEAQRERSHLAEERAALQRERRDLRQTIVREVADVTLRVLSGVLDGTITRSGKDWAIRDDALCAEVRELEIGRRLSGPVRALAGIWERLKERLAPHEAKAEMDASQERLRQASSANDRTPRGPTP